MKAKTTKRGNHYEKIYAVARRIPKGRVATYGQVAILAGLPGHARQVGYALNALPDGSDVPWHRVINAQGGISARSQPDYETIQRGLLEEEGVEFNLLGRVSFARYGWKVRRPATKRRTHARCSPTT